MCGMMRGVWYVGWGMKDRGQRKMGNGGGKVWDVGDDVGRNHTTRAVGAREHRGRFRE